MTYVVQNKEQWIKTINNMTCYQLLEYFSGIYPCNGTDVSKAIHKRSKDLIEKYQKLYEPEEETHA